MTSRWIFFVTLLLLACNTAKKNRPAYQRNLFSQHLEEAYDYTFRVDPYDIRRWNVIETDSGLVLSGFDRSAQCWRLVPADTTRLPLVIPLSHLGVSGDAWNLTSFLFHGYDSLFVQPGYINLILRLDHTGAVKDSFMVNQPPPDDVPQYAITEIFLFRRSALFAAMVRTDIHLNSKEALREYCSVFPVYAISLGANQGKVTEINAGWPASYQDGNDFRDYSPQCRPGPGKSLLFTFEADPEVRIWDHDRLVSTTTAAGSENGSIKPWSQKENGNLVALKQYFQERSQYGPLIYDPYRNMYYRYFFPENKQHSTGQDEMTLGNREWKLLIFDSGLQLKREMSFNDALFMPLIMPVREGVLIPKRQTGAHEKRMRMGLFQINQ